MFENVFVPRAYLMEEYSSPVKSTASTPTRPRTRSLTRQVEFGQNSSNPTMSIGSIDFEDPILGGGSFVDGPFC